MPDNTAVAPALAILSFPSSLPRPVFAPLSELAVAEPGEMRVRRVPLADGLSPDSPAPLELAWHERSCVTVAPGQFLIEVPYVGGAPRLGVDPDLTRRLQNRWLRDDRAWKISAVTAAFQHTGRRRGVLRLALTASPKSRVAPRLDGVAMARDLKAAVSR